ncbi:hypothetical protein, partial [Aeromonas veronii]|uniref:hypothetical protein n=1 Tax=Aeromonas veronii TaxID=654 RepID=UPI0030058AD0
GDKIRSQTKPFLYLFQLVAAKDPVHDWLLLAAQAIALACACAVSMFGQRYQSPSLQIGFIT